MRTVAILCLGRGGMPLVVAHQRLGFPVFIGDGIFGVISGDLLLVSDIKV